MKSNVKFAFLTIVASGIISLASCNNSGNENQNYQDSLNNEEMTAPSDTAMNNMSDTTMDGGIDTTTTP